MADALYWHPRLIFAYNVVVGINQLVSIIINIDKDSREVVANYLDKYR